MTEIDVDVDELNHGIFQEVLDEMANCSDQDIREAALRLQLAICEGTLEAMSGDEPEGAMTSAEIDAAFTGSR